MLNYTRVTPLSPAQIAAGHDARTMINARSTWLGLALACGMLLATGFIYRTACAVAAFPTTGEHLNNLLLVIQGADITYGSNEWLSVAVWFWVCILLGLAITWTYHAVSRFQAERAAEGILNRWLLGDAPHEVLYVPDLEEVTSTQVIAMAYSFCGGRAVVDVVCLDEVGAPMLITGTVNNEPFMEARRTRDLSLIKTALEVHFPAYSATLCRTLNLQPTGA